ncbi:MULTISPECIES: bacteriohopanetetrol glucosamine biosynthesis glycosyltransferase HpnI [Calothrix]|nr:MULTISPECIES: bacteriohopanetetrol glucosamine biosynthesis glycosyltransferase HpnI [Calothrix]
MLVIEWLLLILCLVAICFYCYSIYAAIAFFTQPHTIDPAFLPPVTILKPICGVDRDAEENLASFCQQDYPAYQIIFAVRDREDPAIAIIEQLIQQFPNVDIQLVVSDRIIGANLKVSNLANAVTAAKHEILLIADSDIRVGKDYLQRIVQPLQDEKVGVVTCLYRSLAQGWVTSFEALGIATSFHPGVLVSNQLEKIKFAFGSTIIIRKQALEAIGGFNAIADYLADDFQLGYLPAQAGYRVFLSNYIVDHILDESTLADIIQRQIRWLRCIWVSRPWGYLGLLFTYGTVTSLLLLLVTKGSILGWTSLVITWILRLIMAWVIGVSVFNDTVTKQYFWLIPVRDLMHFAIWCYGFFGKYITWRGQQLQLIPGGKLVLQENAD